MNPVFDFNRWLQYIGKHWNENKRKYLISLGAKAGLMILWYSFLIIVTQDNPIGENMQYITFYAGLFLTGCLHASLIFSDLGESSTGIHFLLVPASVFEKMLSAFLYTIILFFISYVLIFYLVDFSMIKISNSIAQTAAQHDHAMQVFTSKVVNVFQGEPRKDNIYVYFLLTYIGVQSAFLLGSVYFVKYNFIKTAVSVLIVFLFFIFWVHKVMHWFLPDGGFFQPFTVYRIYTGREQVAIQLPEWISTMLLFLFKYTLAPTLWAATYFRLKEKEV